MTKVGGGVFSENPFACVAKTVFIATSETAQFQ
jgi:hypothetical protein